MKLGRTIDGETSLSMSPYLSSSYISQKDFIIEINITKTRKINFDSNTGYREQWIYHALEVVDAMEEPLIVDNVQWSIEFQGSPELVGACLTTDQVGHLAIVNVLVASRSEIYSKMSAHKAR